MTTHHMTRDERKAYYAALPKPRLRGWIHAFTAPLALANGILLIIVGPTGWAKFGAAVFLAAGLILFGHSAVYHIGPWRPRIKAILQRIDHANIFILIAGTYTPLSIVLLPSKTAMLVLAIVWGGAAIGIVQAVVWINAPRLISTIAYIALGWVALWFLPEFWENGGPAIVWLIAAGGIAYTIGAIFYASRWPNPWPATFGFHEFFHSGTAIGYACHSVAIWLAFFV